MEQIEEYDFKIIHRPGRQNGNADALSRRPCRQCGQDPGEPDALIGAVHDSIQFQFEGLHFNATMKGVSETRVAQLGRVYHSSPQPVQLDDWTVEEIQKKEETDKEIGPGYRWRKDNHPQPDWSILQTFDAPVRAYCTQWDQLTFINQVLYRIHEKIDQIPTGRLLIVPIELRGDAMFLAHTGMTNGHLAAERTKQQLRCRAYWVGWSTDVDEFCKACIPCAQYCRAKALRQAMVQEMTISAPFERVSIDFTGPHPRSSKGNIYIITMVDHFLKWAEVCAVRKARLSQLPECS